MSPNRTLDLASALDVGSRTAGDSCGSRGNSKSVMTIAFQLAFEMHMQENVASMARQYVRSVIASVQRVALALSPSSHQLSGLRPPPASPEAHTLARWISHSYRCYLGVDLLKPHGTDLLKSLWHHPDAVMCCSLKVIFLLLLTQEHRLCSYIIYNKESELVLIISGLISGIHICEPSWFRHAGDDVGGTSRYHSRQDLRQQQREEDFILRIPSDHATGTLNRVMHLVSLS